MLLFEGFDMGGTSTDVSRVHKEFEHIFENVTAGVPIQVWPVVFRAQLFPIPVCFTTGDFLGDFLVKITHSFLENHAFS